MHQFTYSFICPIQAAMPYLHSSPFMGINASITYPFLSLGKTRLKGTLQATGKMPVYRAPCQEKDFVKVPVQGEDIDFLLN